MAKFSVVLPAAGQSSRFAGFRRKKPFVELKGRPVWVRTVEHFIEREDVVQTILVIAPDDLDWFRDQFRANLAFMDVQVVAGGATRSQSVRNALNSLATDAEFVAVHDAARPLLAREWVDQVFAAAVRHGAAIPGLPISSTVKRVSAESTVVETVDRSSLVMAQTPQVFARDVLENAYRICREWKSATDEASLVERTGHPVAVIPGWPMNIKITTPQDFRLAELFVDALPKPKALGGLHPFDDERFR